MKLVELRCGWMSLLGLVLLDVALIAQTTGTLSGTVKDPSGSVIPGATVTATLQETLVTRTTTTNESGDYTFASAPVGHYSLTIEAPGFNIFVQKDIELTLGHVLLINPTLQL